MIIERRAKARVVLGTGKRLNSDDIDNLLTELEGLQVRLGIEKSKTLRIVAGRDLALKKSSTGS